MREMRFLFCYTLIFWLNIKLTRDIISIISDENLNSIVFSVSLYGGVGVFLRILFGFIYEKFQIKLIIATNIIAIVVMITNETQYLGLSLGMLASTWGFLNMLANIKSTTGNRNLAQNISLIGLAPLLADLLASPMQHIILTYFSVEKNEVFKFFSILFLVILTSMSFFLKENKENKKNILKTQETKEKKIDYLASFFLCALALLILIFKYSVSSNVLSFIFKEISQGYFYISYHTVIFTLGNIVGVYFFDRISKYYLLIPLGMLVYLTREPNIILAFTFFQGLFFSSLYTEMIYKSVKNGSAIFQGFLQASCSLGIMLASLSIYLVKLNYICFVIALYILWSAILGVKYLSKSRPFF